jgi:hypothetical protein
MAIDIVLYKDDKGNSEEVSIDGIERRADYASIKKKLYCAFEGCTAKMEYIPKGRRVAYFKTWPKNDHSPDCNDYFEREKKNKGRKTIANSSVGLTDKHINNVLKRLIKSVDETQEEKEKRLQRQRKKKKKVTTTRGELQDIELIGGGRPTTDGEAEKVEEGKRAPSVRQRHSILSLSEVDIGTANGLFGSIFSIEIAEKRIVVTLKENDKKTKLYFEEAFFVKAARNILAMFKVVKKNLDNGDSIDLYCVGNVERRNGELCLVINAQSHLRINKLTIEMYVFKSSNPELL